MDDMLLVQERALKVRDFLAELYGEYDDGGKPYSKERVAFFWSILQRVLAPEEEQLIHGLLNGYISYEGMTDKGQFLYDLAVAKLRADDVTVTQMRVNDESYLDSGSERLMGVKEALRYGNARKTLEKVQRSEKGPWIVGGVWL